MWVDCSVRDGGLWVYGPNIACIVELQLGINDAERWYSRTRSEWEVGDYDSIGVATWRLNDMETIYTLQWRHNGRDSVSKNQPYDCFLNRLFRHRSKKTSKLRVTGLCAGNSPKAGEFPAQMASNAENVSIWWRHHEVTDPWCGESTGNRWMPLIKGQSCCGYRA